MKKPIDITLSKAEKLCEVARKYGKQFGIMFNQRTSDLFSKAKEIVGSGHLGQNSIELFYVGELVRHNKVMK